MKVSNGAERKPAMQREPSFEVSQEFPQNSPQRSLQALIQFWHSRTPLKLESCWLPVDPVFLVERLLGSVGLNRYAFGPAAGNIDQGEDVNKVAAGLDATAM